MSDSTSSQASRSSVELELPHRIAVLCYLYDEAGNLLLLHRNKQPNSGMYSPIGGKLEAAIGESPSACAIREIHEESGVLLGEDEVRLFGLLSETAYEGETHWLIFLFEVTRPVGHDEIPRMQINEGVLEWMPQDKVESLPIPDTDRLALWPEVQRHRGGFFVMHIDCSTDPFTWSTQQSILPS